MSPGGFYVTKNFDHHFLSLLCSFLVMRQPVNNIAILAKNYVT